MAMSQFLELKFICSNLMNNPSKDQVHKLVGITNNIPDEIVQKLSNNWLFPIIHLLRSKDVSIDIKEELVKALRVVLKKIRINNLKLFHEIYGTLLIQIFDKQQPNRVIMFHEELKEAVTLCIKDMIHQCFSDVLELLYTKENIHKLGEGILLCLIIARTEKSSVVRLAAIDATMALCHIDDEIDESDIVMQNQVADIIMAFLPGVVGGLQEIAMQSEVQNHRVTMMAIRAWGRIISLIMHDKEEEDTALSIEAVMKKSCSISTGTAQPVTCKTKCDIKHNLEGATRCKEWFEAAAIRLGDCIQLLDKIRSHSHHKIREELVESINLILQNCPRNMRPNVMALMDYLICLSEDECTEVAERAHNVLRTISENYMENYNMRSLIDSLEDKFYDLLTKFPTIVRRSDDNEQLAFLNQFTGYLRLLGNRRLPHIMRSQAHIQRLLLALVHIMLIDCSDVSVLQTVNVKDLDDPAYFYGSNSWRQFKFIKDNSCKEKLVVICKLLGELGDVGILVDTIFELMSDMRQYRKELSLLLNWILASVRNPSVSHLYKNIVDFYTTEELWYLPIEVTEDTSLVQAQSNVVQCCLLTEGLAHIAENLQHDYDRYLLKTLYLIIERAGSGNALISYIGMRTLERIAEVQQHKTIGDLLRANVDYFSYHVIIKLRKLDRNPGVLDVVEVVMKYSKLEFLPHLKGIVEDVLRQLSTSHYKKNTYSFLKVFYKFIVCIKMLIESQDTEVAKKEDTRANSSPSETIILSLLEYYNAKKINEKIEAEEINIEGIESDADASNIDPLEETNEDCPDSNVEDKKDENLPAHIKIIITVMIRCLNFLPSKNVQESLMAMQTLQEGLPILIKWENELLPIVHKVWHPLMDRFEDENVLVINRAWQLLHVLADISNDFIKSRTLRQVLPSIFKFLAESSKESIHKGATNIYKFTQIYKLQYELLSTLGVIAQLLKLREQELWQILTNTQMYLSARQNTALQDLLFC
ncbi:TELO2-interacting protein 1 homolog isoform X2 [Ooceraea biroi]|uniref:TELO2-interacting protein 1 homolog isoform X2 n=1 Tax=Ooceraea biroi TaxID=2015173 RepID=UPI0009716BB9|nr:TELO2-interacting protein 1 homolog isoform X2 [Ooceraea biroi]